MIIIEYTISIYTDFSQIINYYGIKALESEFEDPRFETDYWKEQINMMLKLGKKSEQQAFAGKGLDYVTDTYLPHFAHPS